VIEEQHEGIEEEQLALGEEHQVVEILRNTSNSRDQRKSSRGVEGRAGSGRRRLRRLRWVGVEQQVSQGRGRAAASDVGERRVVAWWLAVAPGLAAAAAGDGAARGLGKKIPGLPSIGAGCSFSSRSNLVLLQLSPSSSLLSAQEGPCSFLSKSSSV